MSGLLAFLRRAQASIGSFAVVAGAVGVAALIVAGIIYLILPELRDITQIVLALGLVCLLIFIFGAFDLVKSAAASRRTRYGTNSIVMSVVFVAIVLVINVFVSQNHYRLDVTASRQYSLARQTVKVLQDLKEPIKVTGFFVPEDPQKEPARNLLSQYTYRSGKLSYDFVDPEAKPAIAREYDVRSSGAIVFESGSQRQQVTSIDEQAFTNAILRVTGKEQKKVYVVSGHGERDLISGDETGLSYAGQGLRGDNYSVESLNLATGDGKVPSDAAVIVLAAPQNPLLDQEVKAINDYLDQGGNALVLVEPNPSYEIGDILDRWGAVIGNGSIVDQAVYAYPDPASPAIRKEQYYLSQITRDLDATFFPTATSISPKGQQTEGVAVSPLASTSSTSWLTSNPKETQYREGDPKGPLNIGVTIEGPARLDKSGGPSAGDTNGKAAGDKKTRLVVIGDSDFATNKYFYSLSNSDLFLNSVNWLSGEEDLISIRPKPPEFRRLVITQRGWNWILYSSIALLPLAVGLVGGITWWRRR